MGNSDDDEHFVVEIKIAVLFGDSDEFLEFVVVVEEGGVSGVLEAILAEFYYNFYSFFMRFEELF